MIERSEVDTSRFNADKDFYSNLHETTTDRTERKKLGQFYTHQSLVRIITDNLPIRSTSTVIDPTCGAGSFLGFLQNEYDISHKNIYGVDVDEKAVNLCRKSLSGNNQNIVVGDCLKDDFRELFGEGFPDNGFDFVIGNPPYKNIRKVDDYNPDDGDFEGVSTGVVNFCTLAIVKSLTLLKQGGFLAFVLPKNILRVDSFRSLREILKKEYTIKEIKDLGHYFKDVRGDQIILIIQKEKPNRDTTISIQVFQKKEVISNYEILQRDLDNYPFYPVFLSKEMFPTADKLLSYVLTLDDVCDGGIFRGIGLPSKHLSEKPCGPVCHRGHSIKKFNSKYTRYLDLSDLDRLSLNKLERLKRPKIVLQNLCSKEAGLTASYSSPEEINIDTVTNVITSRLNQRYVLGLLNSNLANFFIVCVVFLHSNFTMHTDRKYIGRLPIALPSNDSTKTVERIVHKLEELSASNNQDSDEYRVQMNELNKAIYEVYDLSDSDVKVIESTLKQIMSKRNFYG